MPVHYIVKRHNLILSQFLYRHSWCDTDWPPWPLSPLAITLYFIIDFVLKSPLIHFCVVPLCDVKVI